MFYVTYPGSITKESYLPYVMTYNDELGISNVCLVMDRGFCPKANVDGMHDGERPFVLSWLCGSHGGDR
jgi:transposase